MSLTIRFAGGQVPNLFWGELSTSVQAPGDHSWQSLTPMLEVSVLGPRNKMLLGLSGARGNQGYTSRVQGPLQYWGLVPARHMPNSGCLPVLEFYFLFVWEVGWREATHNNAQRSLLVLYSRITSGRLGIPYGMSGINLCWLCARQILCLKYYYQWP